MTKLTRIFERALKAIFVLDRLVLDSGPPESIPIPALFWGNGIDSDSKVGQNGIDSGIGIIPSESSTSMVLEHQHLALP